MANISFEHQEQDGQLLTSITIDDQEPLVYATGTLVEDDADEIAYEIIAGAFSEKFGSEYKIVPITDDNKDLIQHLIDSSKPQN